ncbi:hypothetical protein DFH28DRAFT_1124218 [Melampsora americana]|nr:hypothetical protein DFH28DRAFT_1124218 [Melampsora americana]
MKGRIPINLILRSTQANHFNSFNRQLQRSISTDTGLIPELRNALKQAMKDRNLVQRDVLKSVLGDIQTSQHLANAPSPIKTLKLAITKRFEAAKASKEANPPRLEMEELYTSEAIILQRFLPPELVDMSSEELISTVKEVVNQLKIPVEDRSKSIGRVVKSVKEITGERADGKEIAKVVKEVLELK